MWATATPQCGGGSQASHLQAVNAPALGGGPGLRGTGDPGYFQWEWGQEVSRRQNSGSPPPKGASGLSAVLAGANAAEESRQEGTRSSGPLRCGTAGRGARRAGLTRPKETARGHAWVRSAPPSAKTEQGARRGPAGTGTAGLMRSRWAPRSPQPCAPRMPQPLERARVAGSVAALRASSAISTRGACSGDLWAPAPRGSRRRRRRAGPPKAAAPAAAAAAVPEAPPVSPARAWGRRHRATSRLCRFSAGGRGPAP